MVNFYWSNCLIEAIKAKLKNPKNVKIHIIPKGFNIDGGIHFIWEDKSLDLNDEFYFEFCANNRKHNKILFKGAVSPTKRSKIHRMMNLVHARNKKLRKIEDEFGMKFNQHKAEELLKTVAKYDWRRSSFIEFPLPTLKDAPKRLDFTTEFYNYSSTELEWKVMGYVKDIDAYKIFSFDKDGNLITNGEKITWWKWEMYKDPKSHQADWNSK